MQPILFREKNGLRPGKHAKEKGFPPSLRKLIPLRPASKLAPLRHGCLIDGGGRVWCKWVCFLVQRSFGELRLRQIGLSGIKVQWFRADEI